MAPIRDVNEWEPEDDSSLADLSDFDVLSGMVELVLPTLVAECLVLWCIDLSWPIRLKIPVYVSEWCPYRELCLSFLAVG